MNNDQLQQLLAAVTDGLQRPAGAYALTPGQVDPTNPLDYSTSSGIKIWNEASAPLPFKFNVEGKEVNTFCEALSERANKSGWNLAGADIIMTNDSSTPAIQRNIITEYGRLTVAEITTKKGASRSSPNKISIMLVKAQTAVHALHFSSSFSCRKQSSIPVRLPVSSVRTSLASILTCRRLKATLNSSTSTSRSTGKVSRLVVKAAMTS